MEKKKPSEQRRRQGRRNREKGKEGEREVCHLLGKLGIRARRAQQFRGSVDSHDIDSDLHMVNMEVKWTRSPRFYEYMAQARLDAGGRVPLVVWRGNGTAHKPARWLGVFDLEDLTALYEALKAYYENR